jgi:S-DNA-T family DNA segregation ATPase FtsK/SpoIIIE
VRLLLTAVGAQGAVDLAVDCADDARIGDLAAELARHPALTGPSVVQPLAGRPLGVRDEPPEQPPALWWSGRALDPAEPVSTSPLRHGAVVGVGQPVPDVLAEPAGAVEVRVVGGAGAGRVQRLVPGSYQVGRGAGATVRLDDPTLPEVAFTVDVDVAGRVTVHPAPDVRGRARPAPYRERPLEGPIVVLRDGAPPRRHWWRPRRNKRRAAAELLAGAHDNLDPQADIPLLHLDRRPVDDPTPWPPGAVLAAGGVLLELAPVTPPDASLSPTHGGATLDYNRPPRLLPPPRVTTFALPSEPPKPDRMPLPLALMIAPTILAGGMFWLTRSPYSLLFVAMSPVMAFATYSSGRRAAKRQYQRAITDFANRRRRVRESAYAAVGDERTLRRRDLADPAALLVTATGPRVRLWERRPTDPDWLLARIGTADAPSEVTVRDPDRDPHEGPVSWTAPDVPVAVPLAGVGVTGLAGPDAVRRAVGRWIVAQAAVLHSPADLDIVLLADPAGGPEWTWVRWLPHVRPADGGIVARAAADDDTAGGLVRELVALMQARLAEAARPGAGEPARFRPVLVVLDGARRLRLLPGVVSLLQDGPRVGLYFLCLDADQRQLPEECRAVVSVLDPRTGDLRVAVTGQPDVDGVRPDLVDVAWCERVARALAPIRDVSTEDLAGSLPGSSRLLDVLGLPEPDAERVAQWWRAGGRTTRAVVGEGLDGPFALDIRRDGPHGLVAGTTGSGKSELLQTLIASLAVGNRPDEMTFVLIDYKGGAAFKDCDHLPHTVGMVTDLDGHLTTRALESLGAELRRREHQLAAAGAKDIEDYLAGRGPDDEPMPRLLIVIDEFAALVAELPDFVTGLVDIARRGRSLGVHLLLATQRPAGVVSAEIKSNTNLRIALRVTDANDSQDVLESGDAATISKSTPGRAYARLGHSSLIPFQAARVGGRPRGADGRAAVGSREFGWGTLAVAAPAATTEVEEDVSVATDLATLVGAIGEAATLLGVQAPPSPWLPPLPEALTLAEAAELAGPDAGAGAGDGDADVPPLVIGAVDIPSQQRRAAAVFDPVRGGHLCIAGAPRTGRSAALRAVAGAVATATSPRDVHLYGVDCGNNALLPLIALPHTGAVVTRDQPDRISRLTARLLQVIAERQQLLAERGFADLREQRAAAAPEDRLPYLLVLFDRWEGFVSAFDNVDGGRLLDEWLQILQEGTGVGVKVVMTADRSALVGRLSTLIDDKLLLRLVDPSDFGAIGLPVKQVPESMPPGRGFRADGVRETQLALLAPDPAGTAQVAALQELGRQAAARAGDLPPRLRPFRVDPLPARITRAEAAALPRDTPAPDTALPVAVGGDTLAELHLDAVDHGPGLLIAGPRRSGRSTALRMLVAGARERGWAVAAVTPRQSPLRELEGVPVLAADAPREEVAAALAELRAAPRSLLAVDDLELLGTDGPLVDLITDHLADIRDRESLVAAAGSAEDLNGVYRGPAVALKKSRSGMLLAPQAVGDGDLFGVRLPRSTVGGPLLPGRGLLVRAGSVRGAQVIWPG